jgi:hypothetical protein
MKKNIRLNSLNTPSRRGLARSLIILAVSVGVAVGGSSARAGVIRIYDLTLTENSSTSLSLSYTGPTGDSGFTVMNTGPDQWTIQINSSNLSFDSFSYDWAEPEDPADINEVQHSTNVNPDFIFVVSDLNLLLDAGGPVLDNNTAAPQTVGSESDGQVTTGFIRLTFNDLAQGPEAPTGVPDRGSTFGLMALSGTVLLGASRFRSLRSA